MYVSLLLRDFPLSDPPGMSLSDPRFSEMVTLIQNGDYPKATALARSIISDDIFDIRIICYFLFGVFVEHGTVALPDIIAAIKGICTENWEATGPLKNKKKQVTNSLKWFFRQMLKTMTYEEKKQSSQWTHWQESTDSDTVQQALDLCDELQKIIPEVPGDEDSQLFDGLSKMKSWLNTLYKLVYKEPEPEVEVEVETETESEVESDADADDDAEDESAISDDALDDSQKDSPHVSSSVFSHTGEGWEKDGVPPHGVAISSKSLYLIELLKKINAFENLIKKKKFAQASLVAFDINAILDDFDPKRYFPELFSRYSLLYTVHIKEIITNREYTQTDEWNALQELYKVDIDEFTQLDLDPAILETAVMTDLDFSAHEEEAEEEEEEEDYDDDGEDHDDAW